MHAVAQTNTAYSIGLEESHQSSTFYGDRAAHAEEQMVQRIQLLEESHQLAHIYLRIFVSCTGRLHLSTGKSRWLR